MQHTVDAAFAKMQQAVNELRKARGDDKAGVIDPAESVNAPLAEATFERDLFYSTCKSSRFDVASRCRSR